MFLLMKYELNFINQTQEMQFQTSQGLKSTKFTSNQCQVDITLDEYQQQIKIRILSLKSRNVYELSFDEGSLPEQLKTFLSDVKTVYEYIEVNKNDTEKVIIEETGIIHLIFMLSFGPNSQIKKEILLSLELKEVGSVSGSNVKENFDRLRDEMFEMNKKNEEQRKKIKSIISSVQKSNQKLICQSQQLKMESIQIKRKLQSVEQKVVSLEFLVKDLYQKFQVLKDEKEQLQKKLHQTKLVAIVPPNIKDSKFKKQIHDMLSSPLPQKQSSIIRKMKALEQQRDEERRKFQEALAQKEKLLGSKLNNPEVKIGENAKQPNSESELLGSYLVDSDIQKMKNTVSPHSSQQRSEQGKVSILPQSILLVDHAASNVQQRKVGFTGKFYCGGRICEETCTKCKGPCGPNSGQNCKVCMKMDIQKRGLKNGFLVNGNGQVAWMENQKFCCGIGFGDGSNNCGLNQKYCQWCLSLTENYSHRYRELM